MLYELGKLGGKVCINDVDVDVFAHMLRYLCGEELDNDTLATHARELVDVANRYGAVHLKLRAEAEYVNTTPMVLEIAMDALLYADAENCALLKEAVMDFLVEHRKEAIKNISFDSAPGHLMKDLLATVETKCRNKDSSSDGATDYDGMRVDALRKMLYDKGLDIDGSREAMIALLDERS